MTLSLRSLAVIVLLGSGTGLALADPPKHMQPPPAAFDACAKSKQGDACTFTGRGGRSLKGTCEVPRPGAGNGSGSGSATAALVCRPDRGQFGGGSGSGSGSGAKPH